MVGAIVPWNFPLMIGSWKLAPALAAGNSVVLKPAETASLTLLRIAELAAEAGLPDGVLNVVTGQGRVAGEALALSMDVDVMVFTGSGATGRRLLEYSARSNLKRCYLELGGKSPNIVFADAPDLAQAARVSAAAIFRNAGQVCVAGSRLLVEETIHDAFVEALSRAAADAAGRRSARPRLGHRRGQFAAAARGQSRLRLRRAATKARSWLSAASRILQDTGGWYMEPTVVTGVKPGAPDRAGGGVRAGARRDPVPVGRGGRGAGQRHRLRACRRGLDRQPRRAPTGWCATCARAWCM